MLMQMLDHNYFMQKVIDLSLLSDTSEVPVAAIIVKNQEIIATGFNTRQREQDIIGHAEINALRQANKALGTWNLNDCLMYVNLEPCPMCAGAILQAHIKELVFGAYETKSGAFGSRYNLVTNNMKIIGGIKEQECLHLIQKFFAKLR
jgi:tRNA(adenine34) deaminase